MYEWRQMSDEERRETLRMRKHLKVPHHAPPGGFCAPGFYLLTAACYEHRDLLANRERRIWFAKELTAHVGKVSHRIHAWVVLPNHYHLLVEVQQPLRLRSHMGLLHGRTSRDWNHIDGTPGRKVWYQSFERPVSSSRHYYTSLNYLHNNPIKHGYSTKWSDWDTSSFHEFLREVGRERAVEIWRAYPITGYGESIEGKPEATRRA